jgi:8-oxo-dGTP pyrophosphatase MutT (NUDIX family)
MGMVPAPGCAIPRFRPTARLLVIDPRRRLLLFRFDNGRDGVSWLTPGGGIHRGETIEAAAVRELAEETGYVMAEADLGPVVATRGGIWRSDRSGRIVFGADTFFLVGVAHSAVSTDGHEELERSIITGHRWWTVDELRATREYVSPPGIGDLVASLLADGVPARPFRLPWRSL